ncbi:hypothetical protein [Qaidamihabitans albus]|uniref:hypothetical protein n=1 Tax=Qaidamihabitans albus TaxID=2795733 RepID=UPI0018F253F6|nr:hypothetical protein [Qaidamihabitans albus]
MNTRPSSRRSAVLAAVLALVASLTVLAGPARAHDRTPVIFVHGQQGSAQQWQSNAKRFSGNGYADDRLYAYEYDTTIGDNDQAVAGLAEFVAGVRARTGAARVDVLAHSRGTSVAHAYLAVPERAATVRKYVNIDGRSSATPPGGVPTLALWGSLQPDGSIGGAVNVYRPDLGHTEVATSAESFAVLYEFLTGRRPATTAVLPEPPGRVEIEGRAVFFPQNSGAEGRLEVWRLNPRTGNRTPGGPRHTLRVGADGSFGPVRVNGRRHYELALVRAGRPTYHFYFEPFERSDRFLRLQVSAPGGIADYVDRCPGHTAVTVTRNREWWADQSSGGNDRLLFDGTDVLAPAIAPRQRQVIGVFAFDRDCDRTSRLGEPLPPFSLLPFLTGADLYLPAHPGGREPIAVTQVPRGTGGAARTVLVGNWPSDRHSVTVQFKDS